MATAKKITPRLIDEDPNDPNVRDPEHKHELGGTLGMTIGGVTGGIAAGMATGAALGGTVGPIGAVVGAAIGGAIGGSAGESIAAEINPTAEEKYWEANYSTRPYVNRQNDFETYRPAYRMGVESYRKYPNQEFDSFEPSIRNDWGNVRGDSKLEWQDAREAARDAFNRVKTNSRQS